MSQEIQIPEPLQKQLSPIVAKFIAERDALAELYEQLKGRPISAMTAAIAVEWDTRAKLFEATILSAFEPTVAVLWQTHRAATTVRGKLTEPVKPLRQLCAAHISQYALEQEKAKRAAPAPADRAEISERVDSTLAGVSLVPHWSGHVTDLLQLVKHIAEKPELLFLLQVSQSDLDEYLTRMQGQVALPGVEIEKKMIKRNRNRE